MRKFFIMIISSCVLVFGEKIYATFDVAAAKSADLAFSTSGIVERVYVSVGSFVQKGTPLASLQNDEFKAALEVARASLKQAQIAYSYAKREYERQQKVKNLLDASQFDRFSKAYESAAAALAKAKANVAYKEALLEKTVLKAPFDGVIFFKAVEAGDVVSAAMIRTLLKIQSARKRKLLLYFDQKYHDKVHRGDRFEYRLDGDEKTYSAKIEKIYPIANAKNRKMVAEITVQDVTVGLFGEGYIFTQGK